MSEKLKQAGAELANIAFNLSQKGGRVLEQREADLLKAAQRKWDAALSQPTQPAHLLGHGHVLQRADGFKARCGGPSFCIICQREIAALNGGKA